MARRSSGQLGLMLLVGLLGLCPSPGTGQDHGLHGTGVDRAPDRIGVGDPAPLIVFTTPEGKALPIADFQGHPLVLVFFMGDFCAGCRQQLLELGAAEQAFAEAGAELLAVSADLPANAEKTARFLESKSVTGLQIAADPTLTAIEAFGVRMPGTRYAYHSVFLIDAKGTLRLVARGDHAPANLPSPAILLAELNALDSGPIP